MTDQTQRLEIATVRAEIGSNITYRFNNDAIDALLIPTDSGDIKNLKQIIADIQQEGADKISFATKIYPTTAAGIAATVNGEIFLVASSDADEIYAVWKNNAGVALDTGKRAISASAVIAATDAAQASADDAQTAASEATAKVAPFLSPASTDPTVRGDGSALQAGDTYFNTIIQAIKVYSTSGWVAANVTGTDLAAAISTREPEITGGSAGQYWAGDKTFKTLDKSAVGLSSVDNTSDASKPVSTAQSAAIGLRVQSSDLSSTSDSAKGAALIGFAQFGLQIPGGQAAPAKGFWSDVGGGANIHRLRDRIFIGAAAVNDGKLSNTVKDWLETERVSTTNNANFAVLSTIGQTAGLFGSRTSDFNGAGSMGCIGINAWAINDNATQIQTAYALYGEARRKSGAGTTHGFEFDIVNQGSVVDIQPYQPFILGATTNAWIASGGEVTSGQGGAAASCAIGIINNAQAYRKGIVFHSTSLDGCDGVTGSGIAISMAKGHAFQQLFSGGFLGSQISFDVSSSAAQQKLLFSDVGILFRNSIDTALLQVGVSNTYVNGLMVTPSNTGSGVKISAQGSDTNIDLILSGKGSGSINLNGSVVGTAGAQAGFLNVKINNTSFKIPYYNI